MTELSSILGNNVPIIAHSFSSRGFPGVVEDIRHLLPLINSAYLLSLFDVCYLDEMLSVMPQTDSRIRIWDSGGYEKKLSDDISSVVSAVPSEAPWELQHYIDTAHRIPWNGKDILVSFDSTPLLPIERQLEIAMTGYASIAGIYLRDVLLHVSADDDIDRLVNEIAPYLSMIDIIGFTEKEIAPTWKHGVKFIHRFKQAIVKRNLPQLPIHLFGCLDPKSVIYFTLARASIFDGLSWLRYFFHNRTALYRREFEYVKDFAGVRRDEAIDTAIVRHNLNEMQQLQADLSFNLALPIDDIFYNERATLAAVLGSMEGG